MFKVFVFAAILAFAFAAPEPEPQILVAGGVPLVSSVVASEVIVPAAAQYTVSGVVAPAVVSPGLVIV